MTQTTVGRVTLSVRAVTVGAIMLLLIMDVRGDGAGSAAIRVSADTPTDMLATEITSTKAASLVYSDTVAPSRAAAALLGAAAKLGRDVTLTLPTAPEPVSVRAPRAPVAQRRAALSVTVRGRPATERRLILEGETGQSDSLVVSIGPDGSGTVAVGIEPTRAGLASWTVRTVHGASAEGAGTEGVAAEEPREYGASEVNASTWVRPPTPLRVLVMTESPDWESRYIVRALEAGGAEVAVRQALGNNQVVASSGAPEPTTLRDLEPFDVVVSAGAETSEELLNRWAIERGGGVLLLRTGQSPLQAREASTLDWSAPAEWLTLPALAIGISATAVASGPVATSRTVATVRGSDGPVMTAGSLGRGRLVASGLETWPWVLEGGAATAHSDFWLSVVDWLAGGLRSDVMLEASPTQPYAVWEGRLEGSAGPFVSISDPEGSPSTIPTSPTTPERSRVRFVPSTEGAHPVAASDGGTLGAAIARPGNERLDWTTTALEVGGSGGELRYGLREIESPQTPLGTEGRRDWLTFLLLSGLVAGGWAMRRTNGLT